MTHRRLLYALSLTTLVTATLIGQSAFVYGPDTTTCRREIWKIGTQISSYGLNTLNSNVRVGRDAIVIYRGCYQWNLPESVVPSYAIIDSVQITFTAIQWYPYNEYYDLDARLLNLGTDIVSPNHDSLWSKFELTELWISNVQTIDGSATAIGGPGSNLVSAVQSSLANHSFVLGIQSGLEQMNPRYAWNLWSADVKLRIVWHRPAVNAVVDQKLSTGTSTDSIGRYEGSSFASYEVPHSFAFYAGISEALQATQNIVSGEKYSSWYGFADVTNHHAFNITATGFPSTLTAWLTPTKDATIQSKLIDDGNPSGSVDFKDPWLIDFADPLYGNNLRNQGNSAPFKAVSSAQNNLGTSTSYKGVFLDQNPDPQNPDVSFYSIKVPASQSNMNGFTGCFFKWDTSGAVLQNLSSPDSQGVVFKQANAVVTAHYKANLGSNASTVSATGGGRRLVKGYGDYGNYALYESAGEIWYTRQVDANSWTVEKRASSGNGSNSNPSFAFDGNTSILYAVWERQNGSTKTILSARCSSDVWQSPVTVTSFSENSSFASRPVIGLHYAQPSSIPWITYAKSDGSIAFLNSTDNGANWSSGGALDGKSPSIETNWSSLPLAFVYDDAVYLTMCDWTTGEFEPRQLGKLGEDDPLVETWREPILLPASTAAFYSEQWNEGELIWNLCTAPQVSADGYRSHAAWLQDQMYLIDDYAADVKYLVHQSCDGEGNLSAATAWQFEYWQNISTPSIDRVPRVTASVEGTLLQTTGDEYGGWSSWESFGTGSNPTLALSSSASASKYIMSTEEGSLYRINPGTISLSKANRTIANYDYARVIVACDTSTGEQFSIRMSEPMLAGRKIPFAAINDTLPGVTSRNFLDYLTTTAASVESEADTVSFSLVVSGKMKRPLELVLSADVKSATLTLGSLTTVDADLSKPTVHKAVKSVFRNIQGRSVTLGAVGGLKEELGANWVFSVVHVYDARKNKSVPLVNAPLTEMVIALPERMSLTSYPNPFNPETNISVQLPTVSEVDLRVYDMLGREVMVLVSGMKEAGTHMSTFSGSRLGSGVYFCRLTARGEDGKAMQHTVKLILQK